MASDETIITLPLHFDGRTLYIDRASSSQDGYVSHEDFVMFFGGGAVGVSRVDTGVGLEGGPITTTGTISLTNTGVVSGVYNNPTISVDDQGRIDAIISGSTGNFLPLNGGTMTGPLILAGDPVGALEAATREFVLANASRLPAQYFVSDFNASGSAARFTGTAPAGSTTLTLTGTPTPDFQVGQGILIKGAGSSSSGIPGALLTKVDAISGTVITLHNPVMTAVSAVANNVQHDDTVAIQAGLDAVTLGGTLIFGPGFFRVNGPIGSFKSILKLPFTVWLTSSPDKSGSPPPSFALKGACAFPVAPVLTPASTEGTVIQTDVVGDATKFILAGGLWVAETDQRSQNCSNVVIEGITFRTYDNPAIGCLDLGLMWDIVLRNVCCDTGMSGEGNDLFGGTMPAGSQPTHGTIGIRIGRTNCTTLALTENVSITNYGIGIIGSELWHSTNIFIQRCGIGWQATNVDCCYPTTGDFLIVQCPIGIDLSPGRLVLDICVKYEFDPGGGWWAPVTGKYIYDPNDKCEGIVRYWNVGGGSGGGLSYDITTTGCSKVTLWSLGAYGIKWASGA